MSDPRVRFYYWQVRSSAAVVRSALERGSQCCRVIHCHHPYSHGTLCIDQLHKPLGGQGQSRLAPTREDTLCQDAQGFLSISEAQRPSSSVLPWGPFMPLLQMLSILLHPVYPQIHAYLRSFLPHTKWAIQCPAWSPAQWEDSLSSLSCKVSA